MMIIRLINSRSYRGGGGGAYRRNVAEGSGARPWGLALALASF